MASMNFNQLTDDIIVDVFMRAVSVDVFVDDGLFLHLIGQEGEDAGVVPAGREGVKLLLVVADDELSWVETEIIRVESIHPGIQGLKGKIRRLDRLLSYRKKVIKLFKYRTDETLPAQQPRRPGQRWPRGR